MHNRVLTSIAALAVVFLMSGPPALAQEKNDPKAVKNEDGKYLDKAGNPTFNVGADGTVDWYTFSGFRRYHSECHVCHGPDGEGSTYAPPLRESMQRMDYSEFLEVVVNGKTVSRAGQQSVMPAFGENSNVMCYVDDLYVYLRARTHEAIPRGRPAKREEKPAEHTRAENICMGQKG